VIGNECYLMAAAHVGHNCVIGNQVIVGGYVGMGGHSLLEDQCVIGGMAGIHQFVRIGRLAMVGAHSKVTQDVVPFMLVDGSPAEVRGLNLVGMDRRGLSHEAQTEIKKAFKVLYQSKLKASQALEEIKKLKQLDEIKHMVSFLEHSTDRGISRRVGEDVLLEEESILPEIPELGI
jgi:UDP-N-acetylglucosamine acyltransferase